MEFYIGVDGGGSKTKFCLINQTGDILKVSTAPATNRNNVGVQQAEQNLLQGLKELQTFPEFSFDKLKVICIGMSGVDRPE
jgi:N-acetylglucosamine kinase-like BadF-type ATPase